MMTPHNSGHNSGSFQQNGRRAAKNSATTRLGRGDGARQNQGQIGGLERTDAVPGAEVPGKEGMAVSQTARNKTGNPS